MNTSYVDLKKVFDSVIKIYSGNSWDLEIIPTKITALRYDLYFMNDSVVKCGWGVSISFLVNQEVRSWYILTSFIFNICMHWIFGREVDKSHCWVSISNIMVTDLVFANELWCRYLCWVSWNNGVGFAGTVQEDTSGLKVLWTRTKVLVS